MSDTPTEWKPLIEAYARETAEIKTVIKARDLKSGRAFLSASPEARTWLMSEAWRLYGESGRSGAHPDFNGPALLAIARELLRLPLFCTPDQMQRLIWQSDRDELSNGLLRNIERHLNHWGLTPNVQKMLELKRTELARIATTKKDRALVERLDTLLSPTNDPATF